MESMPDWRPKFLRLFATGIPADVQAAFALKQHHLPSKLYKFFPPSEHAFRNLADGILWLASPSTFNDPFDSGFVVDGTSLLSELVGTAKLAIPDNLQSVGLDGGELGRIFVGKASERTVENLEAKHADGKSGDIRKLGEALPTIVKRVFQELIALPMQRFIQAGLKVTCFTEQATSLLLWAHYASSHTGFCVEYSINGALPTQQRLLFPVFYSATRFDLTSVLRRLAAGPKTVPNHAILAAIHKSPEWAYEREWRLVHPDGRPISGISIHAPPVAAVYAGNRMAQTDRERLAAICDARQVPLREVNLSGEQYEAILATKGGAT